MALSPNRRYLAASEKADKASIIVFDLQHQQGKKRKVLTSGDLLVQEFLSMAFSPDSKYLIAQSGAPEWISVSVATVCLRCFATQEESSDRAASQRWNRSTYCVTPGCQRIELLLEQTQGDCWCLNLGS
uniref:Uncharacterized protein n=1 Tax=Cyprinodon variegatus TaxID=28743 RepID=A0A3Q2C9N0_CYPVA